MALGMFLYPSRNRESSLIFPRSGAPADPPAVSYPPQTATIPLCDMHPGRHNMASPSATERILSTDVHFRERDPPRPGSHLLWRQRT